MNGYGTYDKSLIFNPAANDASKVTALNHDQAIGVPASLWTMIEPTCITRFAVHAVTAFTAMTALPKVSLFRLALFGNSTGTDSASSGAAFLTTASTFVADELIGWTIYNITDGSSGVITDNGVHTVVATLAGGAANHWDSGDYFVIGYRVATIIIPALAPAGSVIYKDVDNKVNVVGGGPTGVYTQRGVADIYAGEQIVVVPDYPVGAGGDGTYQPYVLGHPMAEVQGNQPKMFVSA